MSRNALAMVTGLIVVAAVWAIMRRSADMEQGSVERDTAASVPGTQAAALPGVRTNDTTDVGEIAATVGAERGRFAPSAPGSDIDGEGASGRGAAAPTVESAATQHAVRFRVDAPSFDPGAFDSLAVIVASEPRSEGESPAPDTFHVTWKADSATTSLESGTYCAALVVDSSRVGPVSTFTVGTSLAEWNERSLVEIQAVGRSQQCQAPSGRYLVRRAGSDPESVDLGPGGTVRIGAVISTVD